MGQRTGNMGKEKCCSGFEKRFCQFISAESSMTGDSLEAYKATREKMELKRAQISHKDFGL